MPLESATTIAQLNPLYPLGTDSVTSADDHIRMIKTVLKNTFPNLSGPITSSLSNVDSLGAPPGLIAMWSGAAASIPSGWLLCNGTNGTPDLRDRFLVGAGGAYAPGATGGALNATSAVGGSHTHTTTAGGAFTPTGTAAGHVLTVEEIPSHQHNSGWGESQTSNARYGVSSSPLAKGSGETDNDNYDFLTSATGGGKAHSHTLALDPVQGHTHSTEAGGSHTHIFDTRSPYYALCFIMKV